jgi:diguanylate cyclase (GGDEF)-like protein
MINSENNQRKKGLNMFSLVIFSTIIYLIINVFFYQFQEHINYFELVGSSILLLTTIYLIYVTQKHSTNNSGFYYYTSIGFSFVFFGLFILTLNHIFIYSAQAVNISVKLLFVLGYALIAIGVTKWIKYNETRQGELSVQANTDELTGLLNRRSFAHFMEFEFKNAQNNAQPFSLIIIDIDYFKQVNDNHGHLNGDEVLKNLADVLKKSFRAADKVCRWGGEEFAVLLPATKLIHAVNVAEKIRKVIESQVIYISDVEIKITISLGVSEFKNTDNRIENIINRADEALYNAKNNNRNCVKFIKE